MAISRALASSETLRKQEKPEKRMRQTCSGREVVQGDSEEGGCCRSCRVHICLFPAIECPKIALSSFSLRTVMQFLFFLTR